MQPTVNSIQQDVQGIPDKEISKAEMGQTVLNQTLAALTSSGNFPHLEELGGLPSAPHSRILVPSPEETANSHTPVVDFVQLPSPLQSASEYTLRTKSLESSGLNQPSSTKSLPAPAQYDMSLVNALS